jgi:DNA replication initiation complex subunit (GINS family)
MNLADLLKLWRVEKGSSALPKMPTEFYNEARALMESKNQYESEKSKGIYNDIVSMRQHKMLMGCLRQLQGGDKTDNLLAAEKDIYNRIYEDLQSLRAGNVQAVDVATVAPPADLGQETLPGTKEAPSMGEPKEPPKGKSSKAPVEEEWLAESVSGEAAEEKVGEEPKKRAHVKEEVFKGKTENKALKRVRFLRPMPAFIGPDLETLGPFEEDQVSDMEDGIVEILLKNDAVELVQD